ncbi:MAG: hypothetical protein WCK29_03390 [archaeon]
MKEQLTLEERDKIKKEAKKILDSFASALNKVKLKGKKEKKEVSGFREEGNGVQRTEEFRKMIFANAHSKNENAIIGETKAW